MKPFSILTKKGTTGGGHVHTRISFRSLFLSVGEGLVFHLIEEKAVISQYFILY